MTVKYINTYINTISITDVMLKKNGLHAGTWLDLELVKKTSLNKCRIYVSLLVMSLKLV